MKSHRRRFFAGWLPVGSEKGQALVLIAVTFVVLLGFVGLTTDVGQLFILHGNLKKAVDAASLAAAGQYREGQRMPEITLAAKQVMHLNGVSPTTVIVETCETKPGDSRLCTIPPRKLIRVIGSLDVPTIFLHLVGVRTITITSNAIAEAASMDVVLVIDISESMAWDAPEGDPLRDPHYCNSQDPSGSDGYKGECQPFESVKRAATEFVKRILDKPESEEQDRVAIVTFSNGQGWGADPDDPNEGTHVRTFGWTYDYYEAIDVLNNLNVFEADTCYYPEYYDPFYEGIPGVVGTKNRMYGPCRQYDCKDPDWVGNGGLNPTCSPSYIEYRRMDCLSCRQEEWPEPGPYWEYELSALSTTNIGGGLLLAGNMFALEPRLSALWVVILLTDGMANATDLAEDDVISNYNTYPVGYCPYMTDPLHDPFCVDYDVTTRHSSGDPNYDAEDFARAMADYVGCYPTNPADACNGLTGQGALIFTVGLGDEVLRSTNEVHGRPYGASLLRYVARVGYLGDPDPANDPCLDFDQANDYTSWCGNYYFSPTGNQLLQVFEDIASRIFTRLVQ